MRVRPARPLSKRQPRTTVDRAHTNDVVDAPSFLAKADKKEVGATMWMLLIPLFLFVGVIEVVSIAIRPLTLSVRLFGNIFGGENLLHGMNFIPPFYFLELLVGLIQALVFVLLCAVFTKLMCEHHDEDHEESGHAEPDPEPAAGSPAAKS